VSAANVASVRSSATRCGPLLCDDCSAEWARLMAETPILATWAEAADRSWTERSCRPITGTMSRGAARGECKSPLAESNCLTAASSGVVAE
jgi:hypothetical protein